MLIQELQEKVAELEEALKREQDRSKLLLSDLSRLRRQRSIAPGGSASSGGSSPRLASPSRLGSLSLDSSTAAAGGPAPAGGGSPFAAAAGGDGEGGSAAPPPAPATTDTVVVSRAALELLYLKERAMDAAKDGIVIADCSQPDMPLIYANEGFARMTGYSRSDVLGRNCRCGLPTGLLLPPLACWRAVRAVGGPMGRYGRGTQPGDQRCWAGGTRMLALSPLTRRHPALTSVRTALSPLFLVGAGSCKIRRQVLRVRRRRAKPTPQRSTSCGRASRRGSRAWFSSW
jgi:PAS domain-containing protein